jgi:hypothetical protein
MSLLHGFNILQDLTSSAGEDVVLAMNTFIKRLLAVSDPSQMKVCLFILNSMAILYPSV